MARKHLLAFVVAISLPLLGACNIESEASAKSEAPQKEDNGIRVISSAKTLRSIDPLPDHIDYLGEEAVAIHYYRADGNYTDWGLWLWADGAEGKEYYFNSVDSYGGVAYYPLSMFNNSNLIGFIVKKNAAASGGDPWKEREGNSDRFINTEMINIDAHQTYNIYLLSNNSGIYVDPGRTRQMDDVKNCEFASATQIVVESKNALGSVSIKRNGEAATGEGTYSSDRKTYTFNVTGEFDIADVFVANMVFQASGFEYSKGVSIRKLYDDSFGAKYNYDGELGAIYSPTETTFKVWSPVSQSILLRIYDNGTPTSVDDVKGNDAYSEYEMVKGDKGVFSKTVSGDLQGKYYTYVVTNSSYPNGKEVVDPYAKSTGVNGLRGMIVDFLRTNPSGWNEVDYLNYDRKELTVYETHIAELTCSDTWGGTPENAKKFRGFYEEGTTYEKNGVVVKTGFDHIKELGVNAVQIIPFFDQANDETNMTFNWGYNPLNYNTVEGGYSSDPYDGYARIIELKELIQAYNEAGITIIMDVVYNHVNGLAGSNFDVLCPYYYFRYTDKGAPSNGSGCGNETASDKYMYRKFMIDSTTFWTSEYKLGGFRFDLMGIHDIETMNQLTAANKVVNPNIVIYGEPWAGGDTALPAGSVAAVQANANMFEGYGAFNDRLRDSLISGGLAPSYSRKWVSSVALTVDPQSVVPGIQGITQNATNDPNKTVSYVTCHDNYTMHDRLRVADYTSSHPVSDYFSESMIEKASVLAYSVVFTSQGTCFMLAGEEMLRTKIVYDENGDPVMAVNKAGETLNVPEVSGNSYNLSYKTNEINYELKVDHLNVFKNYQKLIAFKQNVSGLHGTTPNNVEILDEGRVIKVTIQDDDKTYYVYHRNGVEATTVANESSSKNIFAYVASFLTLGLTGCAGNSDDPAAPSDPFVVDVTGAELYLDTLGRTLDSNSHTLQPFETLIISK